MVSLFNDFKEFWHYVKDLSVDQRDILLTVLPKDQRAEFEEIYKRDGWLDLSIRNTVHDEVDMLREETGINILYMKAKILSGVPQYVPKKSWDLIVSKLEKYNHHANFAIGGIIAKKVNEGTVLLTSIRK
ncbi:MAG: hypothetical protein WDA06_06545 [Phenylobacterium sp.]